MPSDAEVARLYRLVGDRVRAARERFGLTQEALAGHIGVARTSITNLEKGRQKIPLHQLHRIAVLLKTDVRALLPSPEELEAQSVMVTVKVGNDEKQVPAQTADWIKSRLTEATHGKRKQG